MLATASPCARQVESKGLAHAACAHICVMPWSGVPESDLHIQPSCNACPSHSSTFLHLALTSTLQHTCMKRKAEWANPWERCRKIPVPPAWPAGCPYCSKTHLSWDEWGCYCTILQDDESENMYWSCRSCMRVTMQKHYQFMKWWRWGGEGDPQEQLATSPFHSHQLL